MILGRGTADTQAVLMMVDEDNELNLIGRPPCSILPEGEVDEGVELTHLVVFLQGLLLPHLKARCVLGLQIVRHGCRCQRERLSCGISVLVANLSRQTTARRRLRQNKTVENVRVSGGALTDMFEIRR